MNSCAASLPRRAATSIHSASCPGPTTQPRPQTDSRPVPASSEAQRWVERLVWELSSFRLGHQASGVGLESVCVCLRLCLAPLRPQQPQLSVSSSPPNSDIALRKSQVQPLRIPSHRSQSPSPSSDLVQKARDRPQSPRSRSRPSIPAARQLAPLTPLERSKIAGGPCPEVPQQLAFLPYHIRAVEATGHPGFCDSVRSRTLDSPRY